MNQITHTADLATLYDEPGNERGTLKLTMLLAYTPEVRPSGTREFFDPGEGAQISVVSANVEATGWMAGLPWDATKLAGEWLDANEDAAADLVAEDAEGRAEAAAEARAEYRADAARVWPEFA